jgi:hypothetical protein
MTRPGIKPVSYLEIGQSNSWKAGADHLPRVLFSAHFVAEYIALGNSLEARKKEFLKDIPWLDPESNRCPAEPSKWQNSQKAGADHPPQIFLFLACVAEYISYATHWR